MTWASVFGTLGPGGQAPTGVSLLSGLGLLALPRELTMVCVPLQRLLLLLQEKDKELEELLQEIQCEKVPSLTLVPSYRPAELSG